MLKPICKVVITDITTGKNLQLNRVNAIEIQSSWNALTDTAKITVPRAIRVLNGNINEVIKRGSKVEIYLGYAPDQILEFTGYVARVDTETPFNIYCEDEMWQLKQTTFNQTFKNTTLADLIKYIYPGKAETIDFKLPFYKISNVTAAKVLSRLKEQYGIVSYFRAGVLHVGFAYDLAIKKEVVYHLQRNVPVDGCKLEFRLKEDYKVRVKGISILPGNKTIEYVATDQGGQEPNGTNNTRHFDGDTITEKWYGQTKEQLERLVNDRIKRYKINGYQGSMEAMGRPFCQHGDIVHIIDSYYPEREGSYFTKKVTVKFSGDGFRRTVELDRLAYSATN